MGDTRITEMAPANDCQPAQVTCTAIACNPDAPEQQNPSLNSFDTAMADKKPTAEKTAAKKSTGKEKTKQRNRAISLINKYAGAYAKEGQKTKWIVDLVMKIDEEYKEQLASKSQTIDSLQLQILQLQESSSKALQEVQQQAQALQLKVQEQELEIYNTSYALQQAQAQHAVMQDSLRYAEEAAATATSECATLAAAVQAMTEQDAKARCGLAHRAHYLRDALLQTSAALRQFSDRDRTERNEKELRLKYMERTLAAERTALLEQQAVHQARDAALETLQLKYHLAAMKLKELRNSNQGAVTCDAVGGAAGAVAKGSHCTAAVAGADQGLKHGQVGKSQNSSSKRHSTTL